MTNKGDKASFRILMLCKAFPPIPGGVESYSLQVAAAYVRAGADVTVITQTIGDPGRASRKLPGGERISLINTGKGGQFVTAIKMFYRYILAVKQETFDLIHSTTWRPGAVTLPYLPAPLVLTAHGRELLRIPRILRTILNAVVRHATMVVTVSTETLKRATEAGIITSRHRGKSTPWFVVNNGISYTSSQVAKASSLPARADNSERVRFLTVARLVPRKNVASCILALRDLASNGVRNFEYDIAGKGPLLQTLRDLVESVGLQDKIRVHGYVEDDNLEDLYRNADIFLHPQIDVDSGADYEGFGITIADAMAFRCAVIAGAGSGPSDFVKHGINGFLVDGRSLNELTHQIGMLIKDTELRRRLGLTGQRYVLDHLSWDGHVSAILNSSHVQPSK